MSFSVHPSTGYQQSRDHQVMVLPALSLMNVSCDQFKSCQLSNIHLVGYGFPVIEYSGGFLVVSDVLGRYSNPLGVACSKFASVAI